MEKLRRLCRNDSLVMGLKVWTRFLPGGKVGNTFFSFFFSFFLGSSALFQKKAKQKTRALGVGDGPSFKGKRAWAFVASMQCSRLKPSYEFHFEGLSYFSLSVEELVQIQDFNPRIQKWNTKLILNLCMNYMAHVFNTMWNLRINDQTPFLVVIMSYCWFLWRAYCIEDFRWRLHFQSGLRFEGLFWERYILKGQIVFEGHWGHQSWTLHLW